MWTVSELDKAPRRPLTGDGVLFIGSGDSMAFLRLPVASGESNLSGFYLDFFFFILSLCFVYYLRANIAT